MAPLGCSEKPTAFARKTIEPLEGSNPCHNSVIPAFSGRLRAAFVCFHTNTEILYKVNYRFSTIFRQFVKLLIINFGCSKKEDASKSAKIAGLQANYRYNSDWYWLIAI
jgi:hypothetical protein